MKKRFMSDMDEDELEVGLQLERNVEQENELEDDDEPVPLVQQLEMGPAHNLTSPSGEVWHNKPPLGGQRPARNIIRNRPGGPTPYSAARLHNEESAFSLIFDNEMVETIVYETNREGHLVAGVAFQPTTVVEMRAFLGLCILRGVYKGHMESIDELFHKQHGRSYLSKDNDFGTVQDTAASFEI